MQGHAGCQTSSIVGSAHRSSVDQVHPKNQRAEMPCTGTCMAVVLCNFLAPTAGPWHALDTVPVPQAANATDATATPLRSPALWGGMASNDGGLDNRSLQTPAWWCRPRAHSHASMVPRQHCRPSAGVAVLAPSLQDLPMAPQSDAPAGSTRVGLAHWAGASALPAWSPTRAGHRPCRVLTPARCLVHNMGLIATLLAPMLIGRAVCAAWVVAAPALAVHQRHFVAAYAAWLAIGRQLAHLAAGWAGQTFLLGAENILALSCVAGEQGQIKRQVWTPPAHWVLRAGGKALRTAVYGAHHLAHDVADAH